LEKEPDNNEAIFYKATELSELGRHDEAIVIFDKILKEFPKNGTIIYAKARSKAQLGQNDDALILLAQAISHYGRTIKNWAVKDSSFDKIKGDPRFKTIVK
jgi:tetratricopeptide (TPR) repeat protein